MKRILSILLVIALSLTACAAIPGARSVTPVPAFTPATETTSSTTTRIIEEMCVANGWTIDRVRAMSAKDMSAYFDEMLYISENETLSPEDMNQLGENLYSLWWYNRDACMEGGFKIKSNAIFQNVYKQAIKQQTPVNEISSWSSIPVYDILYTYFSSNAFDSTTNIHCSSFYALEEDDAMQIAKTFFDNPLFATNSLMAAFNVVWYHCNIKDCSTCNTINDMGWKHLVALSKSTDPSVSEHTEEICHNIFSNNMPWFKSHKDLFVEMCQNILENPNFDFVQKYEFFCTNDFLDEDIHTLAFQSLIALSKNADEKTRTLIKTVAGQVSWATDTDILSALE